ncbi:MAG: hypothetical protein PWP66_599 [Thermosediminibacterales bacterium]|nr:hypothetical protein [Thermosediminibacterales bacterium]NPV45125.1 hypothetical protein [Bacillota bacterium]
MKLKHIIFLIIIFLILTAYNSLRQSAPKIANEKQDISQASQSIDEDTTVNFNELYMIDENYGFGISDKNVFKTTDGGEYWTNITPDLSELDISKNFKEHLHFFSLDKEKLWVYIKEDIGNNMKLYKTTNGGKQWKESTIILPVSFQSSSIYIYFLDEQNGYMLSESDPALSSSLKAVLTTKNGGESWICLTEAFFDNKNEKFLPNLGYPTGLSFVDQKNGWVGYWDHGHEIIPLFRTEDGGKTWLNQTIPLPDKFKHKNKSDFTSNVFPPVFSQDKKKGVLLVQYIDETGSNFSSYFTTDKGNTWNIGSSIIANSVKFLNPDLGWGNDSEHNRIYISYDGGNKWSQIISKMSLKNSDIQFVNKNTAFALVKFRDKSHIYKSVDNGVTWKMLY